MSTRDNILDFMIEIEKLKGVLRKSRPVGLGRHENSAEHSWHVCISALMLRDYADEDIDIDRVIRMLLIHDLGEIDAGDKVVYQSEGADQKGEELRGVERVLDYLPADKKKEFVDLWIEFEAGETADSRYARAIDRVPPLLHNLHDDGYTWKKHGIQKEQVLDLNARIGLGSEALWSAVRARLQKGIDEGILQ